MNQLENGVFPDIGVRKAQAILDQLGLELHVRPVHRRRPDYLLMARIVANGSFRAKLSEAELVRGLLTGKVAARHRLLVRRLDDVDEVEVAERRPLRLHRGAELLDLVVDLADARGVVADGLHALRRERRQHDPGRHGSSFVA